MTDEKPKGETDDKGATPKAEPEAKPTEAKADAPKATQAGDGKKGVRIGAILAAILAVVLVGWIVIGGGDDDSSEETKEGAAQEVSVDTLREKAAESGTPIYWAGAQDDVPLEMTETEEGKRIYVRYLSDGAEVGDEEGDLLTVGTYAFADPIKALKKQAAEPGGVLAAAPGGATVYFNRARPQSVYLAYPGVEAQIEVYDPDPAQALKLVTAGQIVPVS